MKSRIKIDDSKVYKATLKNKLKDGSVILYAATNISPRKMLEILSITNTYVTSMEVILQAYNPGSAKMEPYYIPVPYGSKLDESIEEECKKMDVVVHVPENFIIIIINFNHENTPTEF